MSSKNYKKHWKYSSFFLYSKKTKVAKGSTINLSHLKIPVIVGPTASGKTALAIYLAEKLGFEIISADSRQLVKEMDIGTAKPTPAEQSAVKHHFIDIIEPSDDLYNSYQYGLQVRDLIAKLDRQGKRALLAGGSGLYIQSAVQGFFEDLQISDQDKLNFRTEINLISPEANFQRLQEIDPEYAATVPPGNRQRINRALEVFHFTGKPMSIWQAEHQPEEYFQPLYIGLTQEREVLYKNINRRVEIMLQDGLIDEVTRLTAKYGSNLKRLHKTIGYMEVMDYLDGQTDYLAMVDKIQTNTRHYAKRQLTWFKRIPAVKWFAPGQEKAVLEYLKENL